MLCGELTCQAEKINVNMPQSSTRPRSLLNKFKYSYIQGSCNLCLSDLYPEKPSIMIQMQPPGETALPPLKTRGAGNEAKLTLHGVTLT